MKRIKAFMREWWLAIWVNRRYVSPRELDEIKRGN